jgi:hypothetical protein
MMIMPSPDSFVRLALLTFHEQYHRVPAPATQATDIVALMKIIRNQVTPASASASSSNSLNTNEFNEELLK